jgi:hypothetical protein
VLDKRAAIVIIAGLIAHRSVRTSTSAEGVGAQPLSTGQARYQTPKGEASPRKAARARKAGAGAGRTALRGNRGTDFALQTEWTKRRPLQQDTTASFNTPPDRKGR